MASWGSPAAKINLVHHLMHQLVRVFYGNKNTKVLKATTYALTFDTL